MDAYNGFFTQFIQNVMNTELVPSAFQIICTDNFQLTLFMRIRMTYVERSSVQ